MKLLRYFDHELFNKLMNDGEVKASADIIFDKSKGYTEAQKYFRNTFTNGEPVFFSWPYEDMKDNDYKEREDGEYVEAILDVPDEYTKKFDYDTWTMLLGHFVEYISLFEEFIEPDYGMDLDEMIDKIKNPTDVHNMQVVTRSLKKEWVVSWRKVGVYIL